MSNWNLDGKIALVTGASRGIGRETAMMLAGAGAGVIVNYLSNKDAATATVEAIEAAGSAALPIQCDVTDADAVDHMVSAAIDRFGKIDFLISNAGQATAASATETTEADFHRVIDVNIKGLMLTARATLPGMKERGYGKVVAISSVVGKTGKAFLAPSPTYAAAKSGIVGMVRGMARECAPFGIQVNCIRPGWIDTDATKPASEEVRSRAISEIALGRTGQPSDIAGAVLFLVSEYSDYITGVALDVNGGLFIG